MLQVISKRHMSILHCICELLEKSISKSSKVYELELKIKNIHKFKNIIFENHDYK